MSEGLSSFCFSQDDGLNELILSIEHCGEMAPETPHLSYCGSHPSVMRDIDLLADEFMLNDSSNETGCMDEESPSYGIVRMRVKRKISKKKGQNVRFHGKVSL
jgi:hypothetical protein